MQTGGHAGLLVSVEGVDGAGKSTQVAALRAWLRERGHMVLLVREPGGTALGERVRDHLLHSHGPIDPWAEALLFVAARAQLIRERIRPALASGQVVLCDRFVDSTLAYQGAGRGLGMEPLRSLHRDACDDLWPDWTVLLDLPLSAAQARQEARPDRMERAPADFHQRVAAAFRALAAAEPARIVLVDGSRPAGLVTEDIVRAIPAVLRATRAGVAGD